MSVATPTADTCVEALRASHDLLSKLVADLDADALGGRSYDTEWTIAQVLSHLGSQAEIFTLWLRAGLDGTEVPGADVFHPIWDAWNARGPVEQRDDSTAANEELVARFETLRPDQVESFRLDLFGTDTDLATFARMRLSEHAVHAWDVAVALDPAATVAAGSVELLLDGLGQLATRTGQPAAVPYRVLVRTTRPDRELVVSVGATEGSVGIEPFGGEGAEEGAEDGSVSLPAEAFLRLVYGRLGDHAAAIDETGSRGIADLRRAFRGF